MSTAADVTMHEGLLVIPPDLSLEEFGKLLANLRFIERNILFWLGQVYREGRERHGERFTALLTETGYSLHTAQTAASVGDRFPPSRRREHEYVNPESGEREQLPFFVYADACGLADDDADAMLDEVAERAGAGNPMRREELRARIRHAKLAADPAVEVHSWSLACEDCNDLCGGRVDRTGGRLVFDQFVGQWLDEHWEHEVVLLSPKRLDAWCGRSGTALTTTP